MWPPSRLYSLGHFRDLLRLFWGYHCHYLYFLWTYYSSTVKSQGIGKLNVTKNTTPDSYYFVTAM